MTVPTLGNSPSLHGIGENGVGKAVIAEHPVIRRESPSQSRMEARSDASLSGALNGVLGFGGVDVPPPSQSCGVYHLATS